MNAPLMDLVKVIAGACDQFSDEKEWEIPK
jgi:hypothetical protein